MSIYNSAASSTTAFANRMLLLSSLGSGADASISFTDQVANNAYIGMTGANLNFAASNATTPQMTLNSTGLGIGTSSPGCKLQVINGSGCQYYVGLSNNIYSQAYNHIWQYLSGSTTYMTLNESGTLKTYSTVSVGNATPSTSGAGITFPATQSASTDANTLDDYEEGTFTATLKGSTTDPTIAVTTTGTYTKVGRLVYINIAFDNVNTTGAAGEVTVTGLPFTTSNIRYTGSALSYQFDLNTGTSLSILLAASSTTVIFISSKTSANWQPLLHSAGIGRYLNASFSYNV
jgi:hypothetical protein